MLEGARLWNPRCSRRRTRLRGVVDLVADAALTLWVLNRRCSPAWRTASLEREVVVEVVSEGIEGGTPTCAEVRTAKKDSRASSPSPIVGQSVWLSRGWWRYLRHRPVGAEAEGLTRVGTGHATVTPHAEGPCGPSSRQRP